MQFILENIITSSVSSFFVVVGGAMPIAILIFIFSKKEKIRLLAHAKEIENALPFQEELYKKMAEMVQRSINPQDIKKGLDNFNELLKAQDLIETNKKFIKYAKNYNFISAVGHFLRMGNYIPKSISEHKEISKNLPHSSSNDT